MYPLKQTGTYNDLSPIGSVGNLGAEVLEGDPQAGVKMVYGGPEDAVSSGIFSCTKGKFRMEYPFNEHATVLVGNVTLTNEVTGESVNYSAGDAWFIEQGTPVTWNITSTNFIKHYMAVVK